MGDQGRIFLSYRNLNDEPEFALRLAADLKNRGVRVWVDRLDIPKGADWRRTIEEAINHCAALIAVLSPDYVSSEYCLNELARANDLKRPIFPVILRPLERTQLPIEVQRLQYVDFHEWHDEKAYSLKLDELMYALRERASDQIGNVPDLEAQYLISLIADLESHLGVLEYVELAGQAASEPFRPRPRRGGEDWEQEYSVVVGQEPTAETPLQEGDRIRLADICQGVEQYPRFVLIGAPGTGKTTTIRRLALDAAHDRLKNPRTVPLPLLLNLPSWGDNATPEAFICTQWPFNPEGLIDAISRGWVLLYLDGLNEMGAAGPHKAQLLREYLHSDHAPKKVIVTCRSADYTADLDLGLATVLAEEMDDVQIRRFATVYLGEEDVEPFLARILPRRQGERDSARHLIGLARNPYMLAAMIYIYQNAPDGDLPLNTGALFQRLVTVLWDREERRRTPGWVPFDDMQTALSRLACAMLDEDVPMEVPREWALRKLGAPGLLRAGLSANFLEINGDQVRFFHQLMQEYFAAVGLDLLGLRSRLAMPRFSYQGREAYKWDQVIMALCGIVEDADAVVREVAEVDPWLAAECITSGSGINVSKIVRQEIISRLLDALHSEDRWVRRTTARVLRKIGDAAAVPRLLQALRDGDWNVRVAVAAALREIRTPAVPGLLDVLRDWEWDVREDAAKALRQIGTPALPGLLEALRDESWSLRRGAAWALGELGDPAAVPSLVEALRDDDSLVRRAAAEALGWIRDAAAVPALLDVLRDDDWRVRRGAAWALGWIGAPSIPGLLDALGDANATVRATAAEALGTLADVSALPGLMKALHDDSSLVRRSAAEALGWLKDVSAVPELIQALYDTGKPQWEEERVCDVAAEALKRIGTPEGLAAVKRWRRSQFPPGGQRGIPDPMQPIEVEEEEKRERSKPVTRQNLAELLTALRDEHWRVRRGAAEALGAMGNVAAVPGLLDALRDEDSDVRWVAARALGSIGDPTAIPALVKALYDEDYLVCDVAAWALARIGKPAVPALVEALYDPSIDVRGAAAEALGVIRDPDAVPALADCLGDVDQPWLLDERICDIAVESLELIGTEEARAAIERWRDTGLASAAARGLAGVSATNRPTTQRVAGNVHRQENLAELVESLRNRDWTMLGGASRALKELGNPRDVPALLQALRDPEWFVRWAAAEALAWIRDPDAVSGLVAALRDEEKPQVRVAIAGALREIDHSAAVPGLLSALRDESRNVREAVAETLGSIGDPEALSGLLSILQDGDANVRRAAAEALGKIGDRDALPGLTAALRDRQGYVRRAAAEALGTIGDAAAVPVLIEHLADTNSAWWEEARVCDIVAEALERIGTPEALGAVEEWRRMHNY